MKVLRAVLKGLDAWAALLLGILVTLAVVILLATPGPWQKVVGISTPAVRGSSPPEDIAVFVLGGSNRRCTGVVWLHVDHKRVSVTANVVAPQTQGSVSGGGYVPLHWIVDDLGPQAAADALGAVLKVELDAWVTLDRDALRLAVPTMFTGGAERHRLELYVAAAHAWQGDGGLAASWPAQYETLREALPQIAFEDMNVVAFANYVLGFGITQNELDLQAATSVAETLRVVRPNHVRVRACPAVVDVCRGAESWALDTIALRQLRHALSVGLTPPACEPAVTARQRAAKVLVVLPDDGIDVESYVGEVRSGLARIAGAPVAVRVVTGSASTDLVTVVRSAVAEWGPLAVLVGPARADGERPGAMAASLEELGAVLSRRRQPAVISLPLASPATAVAEGATTADSLTTAIEAAGMPVSRLSGTTAEGAGAGKRATRAAARANVQTLVRACWPGALSPGLASTRLGYSFAACRTVTVGVLAESNEAGERAAARLRLWGYQAEALSSGGWQPELPGRVLYYRSTMRRAALALGGDLGLKPAAIATDDAAPAELTLVAVE